MKKVTCIFEHKVERGIKDRDAGSWGNKSRRTTSYCKTVPWYLDDGTSRINVVDAQYATGFEYTVKKEVTDRLGRSLVTGTLDNGLGLVELVVKRTEEVLPIGTRLTVVGQKKNEIDIKKSQKTGICHRLYSFIFNTFFSPTPKAVTMGHSLNSDNEHHMLLKDQSTLQDSNLVTSSEILVEFRHNIGSSNRKENDENSRVDIVMPQDVQETKFGGVLKGISFIKVKGKEPKKMVTIEEFAGKYQKDSREEQQQKQQRNMNISRDEPHSVKKHRVPRLLTVDSNINEKSDAFIRKKKAAMERELQH
ncbi:hypothetical protein POM88_049352 [Heracleum sosnowskyi]|uniref:RING-type E3 ubiquitin transferase n=1 Tax=Heracleum sosnowskyi TaxID=360622 RepID=A0AAD8GY24_9APIA|nr:hypothetical protein POM88_049352 [Heracleum sosnowskyi]